MSSQSEGGGGAPHPHMHHEGTVTSVDVSGRGDVEKLKGGSLGLVSVLFLCITGSAPLAVFMFNFPFVVGAGNERYAPAAFLFATIVLTIFSVGYVQMARKLRAAGGMFTYVSHGLGRSLGLMSGLSLVGGVHALRCVADRRVRRLRPGEGCIGYRQPADQLDLVRAARHRRYLRAGLLRHSHLGQRSWASALLFELAIILIFTIGVFGQGGNNGVSIDPVLPWNAFKGVAFGLGIFIAFWSWVGFEAAPNYAEESKNPHRIIPIAVYASCVFVGVLYTLAAWASVSSYGPANEAFEALSAGTTTVFGGRDGRSTT